MFKNLYIKLKTKYKLWKAKRLSKKITKATIKAGITEEELEEHGHKLQQWKYETCFDPDKSSCQDCISSGIMLWAFCTNIEEEYRTKFN